MRESEPASGCGGRELTAADVAWLAGEEGRRWLSLTAEERRRGLPLSSGFLKRLRNDVGSQRTRVLLLQDELRDRAGEKFGRAADMLFCRQGLEQATDEWIAHYKARRFEGSATVADVCCGIGGDAIGLSQRAGLVAVDREAAAVAMTQYNVRLYGGRITEGVAEQAERFDWAAAGVQAAHVDPDRRASGRRVSDFSQLVPRPEFLNQLPACCPSLALKLAPATEGIPDPWLQEGEREWIESRKECRQQVVWLGQLARDPGRRVATVVSRSGQVERFVAPAGDRGGRAARLAERVGPYIYEPRSALLAANVAISLADVLHLAPLTPRGGYLTGELRVEHPLVQGFAVQELLPLRVKTWKALLAARGIGSLEIKQRGVSIDPGQLRKQLRLRGEHAATLILLKLGPQSVGILAQRLEPRNS